MRNEARLWVVLGVVLAAAAIFYFANLPSNSSDEQAHYESPTTGTPPRVVGAEQMPRPQPDENLEPASETRQEPASVHGIAPDLALAPEPIPQAELEPDMKSEPDPNPAPELEQKPAPVSDVTPSPAPAPEPRLRRTVPRSAAAAPSPGARKARAAPARVPPVRPCGAAVRPPSVPSPAITRSRSTRRSASWPSKWR